MRILWVSTSAIGPSSRILNQDYVGSSGGWIQTEYESISVCEGIELVHLAGVSSVREGELLIEESDEGTAIGIGMPKITYGLNPSRRFLRGVRKAIEIAAPDIIQLWGTESVLPYAVSVLFPDLPKVTFIQGILGIHERYLGGYFRLNPGDSSFSGGLAKAKTKVKQNLFRRQAALEAEQLIACGNVITDNVLTKAYCSSISDGIRCHDHYLFPNDLFFETDWRNGDYIFTIFGNAAEKGLHQLLKAFSVVIRRYPDVRLCVPGPFNGLVSGKLQNTSVMTPYEKSIYTYCLENNLQENVVFCGKLSPAEMASMIRNAAVFVCPSCMEVHSSSTREALAVGVPVVTSLCGSALELIEHGVDGYVYRYEEFETLAFYIEKLLSEPEHSMRIGNAGCKKMRSRRLRGTTLLVDIYSEILNSHI